MKTKDQYMEELVERFFEGQTTNEEEKQLYLFFKQKDISEHLLQYKSILNYFENRLVEDSSIADSTGKKENRITPRIQKIGWAGLVACVFMVLLLIPFQRMKKESFDPYEGSYVIKKGMRITDPKLIKTEIEATIEKEKQQEIEMDRLVKKLSKIEEKSILYEQKVYAQYDRLLNLITNEEVQKTVQSIIYSNL